MRIPFWFDDNSEERVLFSLFLVKTHLKTIIQINK